MIDLVADLLAYIDRSPTPYHAVAETERRLHNAGFEGLAEAELWDLEPGSRRIVVRNDGSLVAFQVGSLMPAEGGFRIVAAHTDSPNLRLKPLADLTAHGYRQLAVEPYGGVLLHTWLDRDLSLAGRVSLEGDPAPRTLLLDFGRPLVRIPNLAIHLQRELRETGLKVDAQKHTPPLIGLEGAPDIRELVATEFRAQDLADVSPEQILAFDLMAYDTQPSGVSGSRGEFILAPRLDNLASCHAALSALVDVQQGDLAPFTRVVALYDHEEVGSRSAQGAAGTFLVDVLDRVVASVKGGEPQGLPRALAASTLVSADMAHAVHPNYSERHESGHQPLIGGGPVIKVNANQSYATDAETAGLFTALCRKVGVAPQHFVSRSDLACGSTIGPITAARLGVRTVDVGNPMLSMHSCREMAGTADVEPMIEILRAFFDSP
ncbi:MAG: M18 family aminopeptidase [Deltaproteobacteria bacterium]|nr:M18 family aminopeptidase [Deltaproteobacteria bacterium]MBW2419243.1 M18 family aminopeptidase [Deltaproteobacteria bacterium]